MKTRKLLASLLLTLLFASTTLPTLGAEQPITPSGLTLCKEWHNTKPTQKILAITTTALLALLIFTLQNWNFFTFL